MSSSIYSSTSSMMGLPPMGGYPTPGPMGLPPMGGYSAQPPSRMMDSPSSGYPFSPLSHQNMNPPRADPRPSPSPAPQDKPQEKPQRNPFERPHPVQPQERPQERPQHRTQERPQQMAPQERPQEKPQERPQERPQQVVPPPQEKKAEPVSGPTEEEKQRAEMMERARSQVAHNQEMARRREEATRKEAAKQLPLTGRVLSEGDPRPNAILPAHKEFTKTWTVVNTSNRSWPEGVRVVVEGESGLEAHVPALAPNTQHEIHLTFVADIVKPNGSRPVVWKCSVETDDGTKILALTPVVVCIKEEPKDEGSSAPKAKGDSPAFLDALSRLVTLGFSEADSRDALAKNADFEDALDILTGNV